jgi:Cft2 family RNA processing exonuclease
MIRFTAIGGANEIGANSYYLYIDGTGILLDCGMHPRKQGAEALPNFEIIQNEPLDFVIISHSHHDHIGALPDFIRRFPYVRPFATKQTREIARSSLQDSTTIKIKQALLDQPDIEIAYQSMREDIERLTDNIIFHPYGQSFELEGLRHAGQTPPIITYYDAGHILGSAGIHIQYGDFKLFYSGDINLEAQTLLNGATLPKAPVDVLVLECTLGGDDSDKLRPWEEERKRFCTKIQRTMNDGGAILIPVFSIGKMQEMLAMIYQSMIAGEIPATTIYTGGMGKKISRLYDVHRYTVPRVDKEFVLSDIPQSSLEEVEHPERIVQQSAIVLASSGMMLEGTMSYKLSKYWLTNKHAGIFIVGYMDPETPGFRIANAKTGQKLALSSLVEPMPVRCSIERFRFSSHSRREGLLQIVRRLKPKRVILVHGDNEAINSFGGEILRQFPGIKLNAPEVGKGIELR